jgi:hypothetical protein
MSANLFKKVNSSDYISYKKRAVIAGEYATATNTNPIKDNGKPYNRNFNFIPTLISTDISNCLIQSKNYELLKDYKNGFNYIQTVCYDVSYNIY